MSKISRLIAGNIIGLLVFASAGCSVSRGTVIDTFKGEFSCEKNQIRIERPDKSQPNLFRAVGCNRRATYRCSGDYGELCQRQGEPEDIKPESGLIDFPVKSDGNRPKGQDVN